MSESVRSTKSSTTSSSGISTKSQRPLDTNNTNNSKNNNNNNTKTKSNISRSSNISKGFKFTKQLSLKPRAANKIDITINQKCPQQEDEENKDKKNTKYSSGNHNETINNKTIQKSCNTKNSNNSRSLKNITPLASSCVKTCLKCVKNGTKNRTQSKVSNSLDTLGHKLNSVTDNFNDHSDDVNNDVVFTDSDDTEVAHITGTTAVQIHGSCVLEAQEQQSIRDRTLRKCSELCCEPLRRHLDIEVAWNNEDDLEEVCLTGNGEIEKKDTATHSHAQQQQQQYQQLSHLSYPSNLKFEIFNNNNLSSKTFSQNSFKSNALSGMDANSSNNIYIQESQVSNNCPTADDKSNDHNVVDSNVITNSSEETNELQMNSNLNLNTVTGKTRRSSVASSGSGGRMETILEEPTESKISVKEILARFETMHMSEAQAKGSVLSSGARAAAQTLNVPIERLESRPLNQRETLPNNNSKSVRDIDPRNSSPIHHRDVIDNHLSAHHATNDIGASGGEQIPHQISNNNNSNMDDLVQSTHTQHYTKQQSYLHSSRKIAGDHSDHQQQSLQQQQQHHQYQHQHQQQSPHHYNHHQHLQQDQLQQHSTIINAEHQQQQQHFETNNVALESNSTPPSVTKYSLLQFAMQHFRNDTLSDIRSNSRDYNGGERGDRRTSTNRSYAEMVKWQGVPIRTPLLRLPNDLAPLALECFDCILRYCGDIALDPDLTEVKCVYTVLMHCHKYLALRDEVYCQLMKQTTANRSPCPDSAQRAWRLLSILAAYFGCSDALRPYLMEHLTSAASDRRRSCHGTAAVCLTNLRKTARCGGRKNVPSVEEVTAVSAGRSARRQIYRLPGGAERVVNTRCSTVVADVITELCALLGVESEAEQQEFSLYCIVQGDAFTMPLAADEYILDVTTELLKSGQPFYLIFCRSVWHYPLKRDPPPTPLYIEVLFNQVAPDYLEGLLLELHGNGVPLPEVVRDMARIAALLHRAADLNHVPAMKEIKFLLPKPALGIREIRPAQWVALVQSAWPQVAGLSPGQVKAQFLNVLASWPLFGSSFFAVKRIWAEEGPHVEDSNPMWRDLILALNRRGVLFLDPNTHETLQHWPFMEVISTRKVRSEDGSLFLDMKVGNLMQQRVIRVQTEQAHEISRLVRQYITMAQISQRDKRGDAN